LRVAVTAASADERKQLRRAVVASTVGTSIEWYDFFLYGTATGLVFGKLFFPNSVPLVATLNVFLIYAVGFVARPIGAAIFGHYGDRIGRKTTLIATLLLMGLATFAIGFVPSYATIGIWGAVLLVILRFVQGIGVGGEWGGSTAYIVEWAPKGRRGWFGSFQQTSVVAGLLLGSGVAAVMNTLLTQVQMEDWGWRVPFLVSVVLLGISVWIRLRLNESPVFQKMKDEGKGSKAPLTEAFANWSNAKWVILALVGATMGQGVVWYTGQFYALFFLQSILKVDGYTANLLIAWSLLFGTGFFIVFGALSDKIGRKPIILAGCLIAALTFFPIFRMISSNANPALEKAIETVKVEVVADPAGCGDLFNPVGTRVFSAACDTARDFLAKSSVKYSTVYGAAGSGVKITVNGKEIPYADAKTSNPQVLAAVQAAGYPKVGDAGIVKMSSPFDIFRPQVAAIIGLLFILVIFVTMVYGPIAALLVELFPTKIRYTSMSLPYHIGNGWFGGLLPATAFAIVASTGDIYAGLWYPIIFASITAVVGFFFLPETKDVDIKTN